MHDRSVKLGAFVLATILTSAVLTGCVHHRYAYGACAATIEEAKPAGSSGGSSHSSSSSSHSSSSHSKPPSKGPSAKSGAGRPPTGQNKPTSTPQPGDKAPAVKSNSASAPKAQQSKVSPPGEKSYKPPPADVKPSPKQVDAATKAAPQKVSTSGSYRSPVTHHTYIFHDAGWYGSPGYVLDIWDPFNPWNYTANLFSPFYGRPFVLVDRC